MSEVPFEHHKWSTERRRMLEEVLAQCGMMVRIHDPISAMEIIEKYRLTGTIEFIATVHPFKKFSDELYKEIMHGDEQHQKWLREKIDEFLKSKNYQ